MRPNIEPFFDPATYTWSYVVSDPETRAAAVIDSVLDFDPAAGRWSSGSADRIVAFVRDHDLSVQWILETHVHADHLSAATYLKEQLGGRSGIGARVSEVQAIFAEVFNVETGFARDGSQFDHLFADGEKFSVGRIDGRVMHTPGHTPACVTYLFNGVAFVGDTLFLPDYGTARADFPGGDAATLYRSIARILELPSETKLYMCHDYETEGRTGFWYVTTVGEERARNVHLANGITEEAFVAFREQRDAQLAAPRLLLPSVQFNMRGAEFPPPEDNGVQYLKIPVRSAERAA